MTERPADIRAAPLLDAFSGRRILVLGDVMLDEFTWGQVRRISPEAPVPVVEVIGETDRLGGAANVAANIQALGGVALPVAVVGRDSPGERLRRLCEETGIATGGLLAEDRRTTLKTRIIAHNQQVVRADREDRTPLDETISRRLAALCLEWLPAVDAVVVSDYDKGVVNADVLARVLPAAARAGVPVFLDPKVPHADHYRPVTVITPNQAEAELLATRRIYDQASLEESGRLLLERFGCAYVLVTRGREGMSLFGPAVSRHLPAAAREVFDVSGAGDTVIATLAIAHASGARMEEAALLANQAAGIVVGKIGTAVVSREELRRAAGLDERR